MTVQELIEKLQQFPQDTRVFLWDTRLASGMGFGHGDYEIEEVELVNMYESEDSDPDKPMRQDIALNFTSEED